MITADFFSGLGGFTTGALNAGADVVLAANHNPNAVAWHRANHPGIAHVEQDLGELDMRGLPDIDLLVASPCCQGFTPSGRPGQSTAHRVNREKVLAKREVARNTAFAVLQAASVRRPEKIIIENVVEFLEWSAEECAAGSAYRAWRGMLEAFGYKVREHTILASDYGSAQERERAIITASSSEIRSSSLRRGARVRARSATVSSRIPIAGAAGRPSTRRRRPGRPAS